MGYVFLMLCPNNRCDSIESMTATVQGLREQFRIDDQLHKSVYLFTYAFARPEGQRALRIVTMRYRTDDSDGHGD